MPSEEFVKNAVLKALSADLAAGAIRPLAEYVARWPEHAAAVAAAYHAATPGSETPTTQPENGVVPHAADASSATARFGPYALLEVLGRGGQGEVHLARDERLGRLVALKILRGDGFTPAAELRFRREAELAARLDHPGVGAVYEAGRHEGRAFLASAFHPGGDLGAAIVAARDRGVANGLVPRDRAAALALAGRFADLASALAAAHRGRVLHRDLKPSNVLLRADGGFVLADFGLARALDERPDAVAATAGGELWGTPAYLAPELVAGAGAADVRTDLYALGATMFEAFAGRRAFDGPSREAVFAEVLRGDPPRPSALNPHVPRDLDAVIETLLAREPERRYADADAVAADLRAAVEGAPVSAVRLTAVGRWWRRVRRRPAAALLALLSLILLVAVGALVGKRWADRPKIESAERAARAAEADRLLEAGAFELHHGDLATAERLIRQAGALAPEAIEPRALLLAAELARGASLDEAAVAELRARGGAEIEVPLRTLAAPRDVDPARPFGDSPEPASAVARYLRGLALLRLAGCDRPPGPREDALRTAALRELDLAVAGAPVARRLYHLERLHAASHTGDPARRLDVVASAGAVCGDCAMSSLWTVLCLADAGRPEEALAKADAALIGREAELGRFTGMRATLLVNRMRLLLRLERPEEAYAASLAFDGAFPHRAEGALIRAHVRMAHRRPDDARRELAAWESDAAAATLDPALRLELFRVSANAFQATGDAASALRRRTAAAELSRDGEDWLRATAVALGVDVAQALIAARRATALLPQDAKAWAYRGVLETDALEADKALSRAEELVREGRTAPDFLGEELGRRAEMRGAYAAARAAYARSYERGYEPARGSAAAMEARLGRRDALAELARSGFAVAPKDPYPTLAAGYEALESGRFAEAADLAGRSLRLAAEARRPAPTNAEPLRKLALAWDRAQSLDDPETDEDQRASARAAARGERRGLTLARWRELFASEADEPLGSTRLGDLSGKADTPPAPAEPFAELALEAASDVLLALGPETPPADAAAARAFAHRLLTPVVLGATPSADLEVPRLVALLRRLRFLRSHAALAPFADPRHLDGLAPAEHVAWRRLFDRAAAAESAAAALLARTVGGRLYGEP